MTEDAVARLDRLVDTAAEQVAAFRARLLKATGDRPWGSDRLTAQQKRERFLQMYDDVAAWQQALDSERALYNLPPDATPKRLIKEVLALQESIQETQG